MQADVCKISAGSADSSQIFRENSYISAKYLSDILQIRENPPQITAVLSQICYRYLQTFNIYVSLVRDIYPRQLYCIKSRKRISHPHNHEVINGPQTLGRVLLCTQRASFYDANK